MFLSIDRYNITEIYPAFRSPQTMNSHSYTAHWETGENTKMQKKSLQIRKVRSFFFIILVEYSKSHFCKLIKFQICHTPIKNTFSKIKCALEFLLICLVFINATTYFNIFFVHTNHHWMNVYICGTLNIKVKAASWAFLMMILCKIPQT